MTTNELQALLELHDDGILKHGSHEPGRAFCALEFESKVRGRAWSDQPVTLPDLRPLNDASWSSDKARTEALLPVMAALWDWPMWSQEQRRTWVRTIIIQTVRQILAGLSVLPATVRVQCRKVKTLDAVMPVAVAATNAASCVPDVAYNVRAVYAARAAARAATHASTNGVPTAASLAASAAALAAVASDTTEAILLTACQIWIDAAKEVCHEAL